MLTKILNWTKAFCLSILSYFYSIWFWNEQMLCSSSGVHKSSRKWLAELLHFLKKTFVNVFRFVKNCSTCRVYRLPYRWTDNTYMEYDHRTVIAWADEIGKFWWILFANRRTYCIQWKFGGKKLCLVLHTDLHKNFFVAD